MKIEAIEAIEATGIPVKQFSRRVFCFIALLMLSLHSQAADTCFGDVEYQQENKTVLRGLDTSCLAYVGVLPLEDYQVIDIRADHDSVIGLPAVIDSLKLTVPELKYQSHLKQSPLLLVDQGHDVALMNYYCHKLHRSGFKQVKIAVGGLSALLQHQPHLATQESDQSLVFLHPRQAYSLLEKGFGQVVVLDRSVKKFEVADDAVFTDSSSVLTQLKNLQKQVKKVNQWQPIVVIGTEQDYRQYLKQLKRPLTGVYLLQGGWAGYVAFKQQYEMMMAKRLQNEVSPCERR